MIRFLVKKLVWVSVVLVGATLITFILMHAIPGNPWQNYSSSRPLMANVDLNQAMVRELTRRFGLDLPLWRQYIRYTIGDFDPGGSFFCGAICGNFGPSIARGGRSVLSVLFTPIQGHSFWESQVGYSIRLVIFGAFITVGAGIPLGILSAAKPQSAMSRSISVGLAALVSIPNFVLGLFAIILFATWLKVITVIPDWKNPQDWILPAFVLAAMPMSNLARITRTSLVEILHDDYIRTGRAKGLTETRVMLVHVLRNALVPILTFLGPTLVEMFVGLFVVENMFSFPGFGREYWNAILKLDYPMIMGLTILYAVGIVLVNLLSEVACAVLDPRIRLDKRPGVL